MSRNPMWSSFNFVVPVFKNATYVRETIQSLLGQTGAPIKIIVRAVQCSELPNQVEDLAGLQIINVEHGRGIGGDWEDALRAADGQLTTLAHSDDIYMPSYAQEVRAAFEKYPNAGICFTDSGYINTNFKLKILLFIKKLLTPGGFQKKAILISPQKMRRALRWGCFIACPTVTYKPEVIKLAIGDRDIFQKNFKVALDWEAWVNLAMLGVSFIYVPKRLVKIRVHAKAETQNSLADGARSREEFEILKKLWGKNAATILSYALLLGQRLQKTSKEIDVQNTER